MQRLTRRIVPLMMISALASGSAWCDDKDALALQSDEPAEEPAADKPLRLVAEVGLGHFSPRIGGGRRDGRRLSIDLRYSAPLSPAWRLRLSDRIDHVVPASGAGETVNTLREALVTWQSQDGHNLVDIGRVNARQGPALGYNPTDYFRTGGLRAVTSADPVALREQRQGTFMARYSRVWDGGGLSVALAPRLDNATAEGPWGVDVGATNHSHRAMVSLSGKFSERLGGQATMLFERGEAPQLGASASALAGDNLVFYSEWSTGKLRSTVDVFAAQVRRRHQAVLGMTYTLPGALVLTLEAAHNGAGLDRAGWHTLFSQGPGVYQPFLRSVQRDQDLAGRQAWLVHVSKSGLAGVRQLELKGFVRANQSDGSRLAWAELRYHWPQFDAALQWQRASGDAQSEFGAMPYRQLVQLIGAYFW